MSFFKSKPFLLIVAVLFIVLVLVMHWILQPVPGSQPIVITLNPLQTKALDNVVEMNKLIISLALLVIGACAAILVQKYSNLRVKTILTKAVLLFCILFAASSIFSGYVLYDNLVAILSIGYFNSADQLIQWPQRLQFYSFFISVLLFGFFILNYFLEDEKEPEPEEKEPILVKIVENNIEETLPKKEQ